MVASVVIAVAVVTATVPSGMVTDRVSAGVPGDVVVAMAVMLVL